MRQVRVSFGLLTFDINTSSNKTIIVEHTIQKMMGRLRVLVLVYIMVVANSMLVSGFVPIQHNFPARFASHQVTQSKLLAASDKVLTESGFENKQPSSVEARAMGVLEWPKQTKMGAWTERFDAGKLACRYILEGGGMVVVTLYENDGYTPKVDLPEEYRVVPGCLVEAMGPCKLEWQTDEGQELVILTPGYEEASKFAIVGALFIVLCGALIAGVGQ